MGVEYHSFLGQLYFNTFGHGMMGAAFVYIGAKIAPSYQRNVAYLMVGLGLVLGGLALFPAIMMRSGWAIWGLICAFFGIGVTVYMIIQGETDLE